MFLELTTPLLTLSLVLISFRALPLLTCRLSSTPRHSPPRRQHVLQRQQWPLTPASRSSRDSSPAVMFSSAPLLPVWIDHFFRLSSAARPLMHFTLFSPWCQGLPPSDSVQVFVAWHEQGCRRLGFELDWTELDCQRTKVARHVRPPVQRMDVPSCRFSHVHVDLVGPLPSVHGYTHVLTVLDRSTCWPAAYPIQDTSTTACINALVEWISSFRVPATITSD